MKHYSFLVSHFLSEISWRYCRFQIGHKAPHVRNCTFFGNSLDRSLPLVSFFWPHWHCTELKGACLHADDKAHIVAVVPLPLGLVERQVDENYAVPTIKNMRERERERKIQNHSQWKWGRDVGFGRHLFARNPRQMGKILCILYYFFPFVFFILFSYLF